MAYNAKAVRYIAANDQPYFVKYLFILEQPVSAWEDVSTTRKEGLGDYKTGKEN